MTSRLTLEYNGMEYDLGIVKSLSAPYTKSTSDTPIVSRTTEDTISIESDSRIVVSASTVRVAPESGTTSGSDPTRWTNAYWYERMHAIADRWQARTNGFVLRYHPASDNPYVPAMEYNGFLKSMSRTYKPGEPSTMYVSIEFHVGTMVVNAQRTSGTASFSGFQVLMSDADESAWYALLAGDDISCVTDYTLYGGVEQPFETLTLTVPRNRLAVYAPDLIDKIEAGRNRIVVTGFGSGSFTVVKCKLRSKTYTITAYCDAERIRGCTFSSSYTGSPVGCIDLILKGGTYGLSLSESDIVRWYDESNSTVQLSFEKGTNSWYALQVAVMAMGCRVWFADGKAYVADLRTRDPEVNTTGCTFDDLDLDVDLYTEDSDDWMYARTVGSPELNDEGLDTVVNTLMVYHSDGSGSTESESWTDTDSVDLYGERSSTVYLSDQDGDAAEAFATAYISYRREPQTSVTFEVKEYLDGSGVEWSPVAGPLAFASAIGSVPDEFTVTRTSEITGEPAYQLLALSEYTRSYPEGTTEYSFGIISNIDLSTSTSQIVSSRGA